MLPIVGIAISGVSFLLNTVGLAIPYWLYVSNDGLVVHAGLWTSCASEAGQSECVSYPGADIPSSLQAVRAMEVIAMLILFVVCVSFILKQFVMKENAVLLKVAGLLGFISAVCAIIGCAIFAAKTKKEISDANKAGVDLTLHAGFALCIVAAVGAIASGIVSFLAGR